MARKTDKNKVETTDDAVDMANETRRQSGTDDEPVTDKLKDFLFPEDK